MTSKNIPYIRKLDHLRFFAAWLVGVYHYYHFQSPAYSGFKDPRVLTEKPFFELRRSYLKKKPESNTNVPDEITAPSPS